MFLEICKYTIPSLIIVLCVWIVMHHFYKNEHQKRMWELQRQSQKEISPIRLRAYERLALVIERTQPDHLLMEVNISEMTVLQLQQHLLRQIRLEFDHNMSQQIYMSAELWDKLIFARDEMAAFVNQMAVRLPEGSTSMDYAKVLLTAYHANGETPHEKAMAMLKAEVGKLI
ncbi:MAG: hypothetical protein MJZ82_02470 [Paludibacteraceae bacterium]|nr:hypothetical protein [Paludibacteraceae bacterium]